MQEKTCLHSCSFLKYSEFCVNEKNFLVINFLKKLQLFREKTLTKQAI